MPKLLKTGEVQLHMPRTGGKSLAKDLGIEKFQGTMHDGPEQIPYEWSDYTTVATFRDPRSWRSSMRNYLRSLESDHIFFFMHYSPSDLSPPRKFNGIDPTFGLWDDPKNCFRHFAIKNGYRTWYEVYLDYFITPADRIVPISKLQHHIS